MKILGIGGGREVPSSFFRLSVISKLLRDRDLFVDEWEPKFSRYPPPGKIDRLLWLSGALCERAALPRLSTKYDAVILQREMVSTIPTFERFLNGPIVFDVDDAVFLRRGGWAAKSISKSADAVVCGNNYLKDWFSGYSDDVTVIPTGVDIDSMPVRPRRLSEQKRIVGWIGTPSNLPSLNAIAKPLLSLKEKYPNIEIRVVTSDIADLDRDLASVTVFKKWYRGVEFDELPDWSLGVMPLEDNQWSRGKCSFKMLQYMAAGIPVVVSPVGMNNEILDLGDVGFSASGVEEWFHCIERLITVDSDNFSMGMQGRRVVEENYSLQVVSEMWIELLSRVANFRI